MQLLSGYLLYPGKYDKQGYDTVFVYGNALQDPTYKLSFSYLLDAILGYFYDLSEQILSRDFVRDVRLVCVLGQEAPFTKVTHNLLDFVTNYKGHNLKLLIVKNNHSDRNSEKKLKQLLTNSELGKVFTELEQCKKEDLPSRMDTNMIPQDLGGEYDTASMDIWLNKRLKFEVFWEDCRMCYSRLQYLPQTLQQIFKEVTCEHKGKSLETIKQKYREATAEHTFTIDQRNFPMHSECLLDELAPEETTNDKMVGDAIRTLGRVMTELEEHYKEYQSILETSLEAHSRWQEFKKEAQQLTISADDLKSRIADLNEADTEKLNDAYSVLQSAKTALHEMSKKKSDLPTRKQKKADVLLENLDKIITENFAELGKNNEKMVNTEFVLNIQGDILSWIKEFEDTLYINQALFQNDTFRAVLEKDTKIRKMLKYCPLEVIEEYFETCQKIGSDFLLASMLGVETCISRLIEKLVETNQQVTGAIKSKADMLTTRINGLLQRVKTLDNGAETLVELTTSCEKVLFLIGTFSESQAIEPPEIPDISFLEEYKNSALVSQTEVLDELEQTVVKCVQSESEELSLFQRKRTVSKTKRGEAKSPFSSTASSRSRRDSLKKLLTTSKTTDDYIDDLEKLVQGLEQRYMCKLIEDISNSQMTKAEKSSQKLYHILKEFMDTEKVYIKSLEYLHDELVQKATTDEDFVLDPELKKSLRTGQDMLFRMIQLNKSLNSQVRSSSGGGIKFARIFTSLGKEFEVYIEFIKLQSRLEEILSLDYFKDIQSVNSDALPAESYVCKPMQRLCKYKLLFEDALSNTNHVFEVPTIYRAVLQSGKLLRSINGILHLQEETFGDLETSQFYLYARVSLLDHSNPERKAYLFKDNIYLSKPSPREATLRETPKEYVSYSLDNVCLLAVDKAKLEMVLNVSKTGKEGGINTLRRSTSLKKFKGPPMITLVFHEYSDFVEWCFKLKNVLGKYY
ncbi:hypothetical protein ACHWQZ_G008995 [Mnemiopsis leidyi]